MVDFITLLNRGKRKYIDKYMKKRKFGKCEGCDTPALLLTLSQSDDSGWRLCESCYGEAIIEIIE